MTLAKTFLQEIEEKREGRRAVIILGPEGSGTYMLADAVEASDPGVFVIRKSYPHAGEWPKFLDILTECRFNNFYDIKVLFIVRDFYATAQSVLHRDPERSLHELYTNQAAAIAQTGNIVDPMTGVYADDFTYLTYESFLNEGFRRWLFEERLGLPYPEEFEVYDGNAKYYKT